MSLQHETIAKVTGLTPGGWILLLGCAIFVIGLCIFCFWRLLTESSPTEHHHAPLDIDTYDTQK